jgi:hypothetical protein
MTSIEVEGDITAGNISVNSDTNDRGFQAKIYKIRHNDISFNIHSFNNKYIHVENFEYNKIITLIHTFM